MGGASAARRKSGRPAPRKCRADDSRRQRRRGPGIPDQTRGSANMRNSMPVYLAIMTAVALGALVLTAILLHNAGPRGGNARAPHKSPPAVSSAAHRR